MNGSDDLIAELDSSLAEVGEEVILRRITLGPNGTQIPFDVTCKAVVSLYQPHELVTGSGIIQGDSKVILSPSEITRSGWPGAQPSGPGDKRVPRNGDKIVIGGRQRNIVAADPIGSPDLVRIEIQVRG